MGTLRVAACQYEPHIADNDGNVALAARAVAKAVNGGAQLIVLPELASSGYVFQSEREAEAASESIGDGPFAGELVRLAHQHDVTIVAGVAERGINCRYNSAVIVDSSGVRAVYRKLHRFFDEQTWFESGSETIVVETEWGRLGVLICYDLWFPEVGRSLALAGADVVAVPTNWVASHKKTVYDQRGYCQGNYVAMATSAQNGFAMVCADRIGVEREVTFLGASIVVAPDGWPVAGPASRDAEQLLIAHIDLDDVAKARRRTPRNDLLGDRRPDSYNARVVSSAEQSSAHRVRN